MPDDLTLKLEDIEAITDIKSAMRLALIDLEESKKSKANSDIVHLNALKVLAGINKQLKEVTAANSQGETKALAASGKEVGNSIVKISDITTKKIEEFDLNHAKKKKASFYFFALACGFGICIGLVLGLAIKSHTVGF
jgi:hypothetical protein